MKISKKTVCKYFPDKETLAIALYEKYYSDAAEQAKKRIDKNTEDSHRELLKLYFDSKAMTCGNIFNKYKLNQAVNAYTTGRSDTLWEMISMSFCGRKSDTEKKSLRMIVDGTFEKLCNLGASPDDIIERLMDLLRDFLEQYVGRGEQKKDRVSKEDVEVLIRAAVCDGIEQDIIDYGTAHPEAPFWDFLKMLKPGLCDGVTQEELLSDDD